MTTTRSTEFLDKLDPEANCPGFQLWEVTTNESDEVLLMASDEQGGLGTRLFFRTNGRLSVKSAKHLGPNPDRTSWNALRGNKN